MEGKTLTKNLPPSNHEQLVSSRVVLVSEPFARRGWLFFFQGGKRRHLILGRAATTRQKYNFSSPILQWHFPWSGDNPITHKHKCVGRREQCRACGFVWSFGHIYSSSSFHHCCQRQDHCTARHRYLCPRGSSSSYVACRLLYFLDLRVLSVCPVPTPCRASHLTIDSLGRRDILLAVVCHGTAPAALRCHTWNMQHISSLLGPHDIEVPPIRPQLWPAAHHCLSSCRSDR